MKKLILIFLILFLISPNSWGEDITSNDYEAGFERGYIMGREDGRREILIPFMAIECDNCNRVLGIGQVGLHPVYVNCICGMKYISEGTPPYVYYREILPKEIYENPSSNPNNPDR